MVLYAWRITYGPQQSLMANSTQARRPSMVKSWKRRTQYFSTAQTCSIGDSSQWNLHAAQQTRACLRA